MKKVISAALLLSCSVAFAQTTAIVTQKTIKGSDMIKMMPKITDPKIYDKAGNIVDSAAAVAMLKTYNYTQGYGIPAGQTETKHMIFKTDPAQQKAMDDRVKLMLRPANPKLWEGKTLDLKPLVTHTDTGKLAGKAVILIFWKNVGQPVGVTSYAEINDIVAKYIGSNKFEVFAITNLDYDGAFDYSRINPISNAHHIMDAKAITDAYNIKDKPAIIVTDTKHQITYSATDFPAMTPRVLNKQLSEL